MFSNNYFSLASLFLGRHRILRLEQSLLCGNRGNGGEQGTRQHCHRRCHIHPAMQVRRGVFSAVVALNILFLPKVSIETRLQQQLKVLMEPLPGIATSTLVIVDMHSCKSSIWLLQYPIMFHVDQDQRREFQMENIEPQYMQRWWS